MASIQRDRADPGKATAHVLHQRRGLPVAAGGGSA